jgi:hypothetical protein
VNEGRRMREVNEGRGGITFGLNASWHIVAVANVPRPSTRTNSHRPFKSCMKIKQTQCIFRKQRKSKLARATPS